MSEFTIFTARRVITMNPAYPSAEAVAVQGDRILGAGTLDQLRGWGEHRIDHSFAGHVLAPGFVEAHSHAMGGGAWNHVYVGWFERRDPDGATWSGCKSIDAVVERLRRAEEAMTDPSATLIAWGLDPIYMTGERLVGRHLDAVSETRPIFVYHASAHLATVNSALMRSEGIDADTQVAGVARDAHGLPNGELQEPAAMSLASHAWGQIMRSFNTETAKWNYANDARNHGHTLVTDLGGSPFTDQGIDLWRAVTTTPGFPARVMVAAAQFGGIADPEALAEAVAKVAGTDNPKLRFGIVKLVLDGSIQGFTARLNWPYYHNPPEGAADNGLWLMPPEQLADVLEVFHRKGLTVHVHCNGDQAAEVFIDAVEEVLRRHPRWDHRHTVQHCQLATPAQYRRMKALGMCANLFANHIFYWGDEHVSRTVGPERAARMNACASAEREGVAFSIHSDTPVTPLGHLHVMWCAVNRLTASGQVLGPDERISVATAMQAATLGAAYQLKLDHEIGSIEAGKLADFAVLAEDPFEVDPMELKNIEVWGTVLGGEPMPAPS